MQKLITVLIFKFFLLFYSLSPVGFAFAKAPSTYSQLRQELSKNSESSLMGLLNDFVKASAPSRMIGQVGHEKAQAFISDSIKSFDPKKTGILKEEVFTPDVLEAERFYQKDFDERVEGKIPKYHPEYKKWFKFTAYMKQMAQKLKLNQGKNIIWEKAGLDPSKTLILTAHFDTISHDPKTLLVDEKKPMPGANFNATGVALALMTIKTLAQMELNYSVQVVFLDWQGIGFLGPFHFAQELKKSNKSILGFINLEMLGQDTSFFDKTKKLGNMCVYSRPQDEKFVAALIAHGQKITSKVNFISRPSGPENSDTIRLWEQGLLGGTFSQNWEEDFNPKFYQTVFDTPETLNRSSFHGSYEFIAGALIASLLDLTK